MQFLFFCPLHGIFILVSIPKMSFLDSKIFFGGVGVYGYMFIKVANLKTFVEINNSYKC